MSGVMLNGKWGYIDKSGKEVIKLKYDYVFNFKDGAAVVNIGGIMNRNYELETTGGSTPTKITIGDLSTYIDPVRFNYIFADTSLEAMNFWIQTKFDIKARRLISAKQIPNL